MNSNRRFFFIHIPKTAGTSFRLGLTQALGEDSACYDYGPKSDATNSLVKEYLYQQMDPWRFQQAFENSPYKFLGGHVIAQRYIHMLGAPNTLTFIREPTQRILSEYQHFVRHNGYCGSLSDFIHNKHFQNLQHRKLQHVPLTAFGFIGLTEDYEESIRQINALHGLEIPILENNTARPSLTDQHIASDQELDDIARLNETDIHFYQDISKLYRQRLDLMANNKPFTRGELVAIRKHMLSGWAVRDDDDNPITVSVLVNDQEILQVTAVGNRPQLKALGLGRGGYIGFHAKLPKLKAGDTVRCITTDTGQELAGSPYEVSKQHL